VSNKSSCFLEVLPTAETQKRSICPGDSLLAKTWEVRTGAQTADLQRVLFSLRPPFSEISFLETASLSTLAEIS